MKDMSHGRLRQYDCYWSSLKFYKCKDERTAINLLKLKLNQVQHSQHLVHRAYLAANDKCFSKLLKTYLQNWCVKVVFKSRGKREKFSKTLDNKKIKRRSLGESLLYQQNKIKSVLGYRGNRFFRYRKRMGLQKKFRAAMVSIQKKVSLGLR